MSDLLEKIRSRGYWRVLIRPVRLKKGRIANISSLYPIIEKASVELRGWDFPHVDPRVEPHRDIDWVGQESEWDCYLEVWRLYQSGQFVDVSGIPSDWRNQSTLWRPPEDWKPGQLLGIGDTVARFTEIFEFAARLSLTDAGDEVMHMEVTLGNLRGRRLWADDPRRSGLRRQYQASIQELPYEADLARADLVAQPRELAVERAMEVFRRFGWEPWEDSIRDMQLKLGRW